MLAIYRICPIPRQNERRPVKMNKHQVIDWSLKSFITAFMPIKPRVLFILDRPDALVLDLIKLCPFPHEVETIDGADSNYTGFFTQIEAAQYAKEEVLLVDDDYWWIPGAGKKLLDITANYDIATPYDSPTYYKEPEPRILSYQFDQHWQEVTASSTTFILSGGWLAEKLKPIFIKHGIPGAHAWEEITRTIKLVAPVGALATKMESHSLSPGFKESFFY